MATFGVEAHLTAPVIPAAESRIPNSQSPSTNPPTSNLINQSPTHPPTPNQATPELNPNPPKLKPQSHTPIVGSPERSEDEEGKGEQEGIGIPDICLPRQAVLLFRAIARPLNLP